MRYRKKPGTVEAIQWTGRNTTAVRTFIAEHAPVNDHTVVFVPRRGGQMTEALFSNMVEDAPKEVTAALWVEANKDWLGIENTEWIIADVLGVYPCKDKVFKTNYEPDEERG